MTVRVILCINSGSSSLKFSLRSIAPDGTGRRLLHGAVERIGAPGASLHAVVTGADEAAGETVGGAADIPDHRAAVRAALALLDRPGLPPPDAAGHRVVFGGPDRAAPWLIDDALLETMRRFIPFAPLHVPGELACIESVRERLPALPQAACFDTSFHHAMPEAARRFPLPDELARAGVRRYGFHGLSYEYVLAARPELARGRTVIAHLGNGASLAAVLDGRPADTTMGFSPLGGLMMGTRSGDLDPGVPIYLMREMGHTPESLERLLGRESGLRGVSGATGDMRLLLERRAADPAAALAIEMFCLSVRKGIGAMAAALGGLDALVFTGGIGERAAPVRAEVCGGLGHLGVAIDPVANAEHREMISPPGVRAAVLVIPTDEEHVIARRTLELITPAGRGRDQSGSS